MVKIVQKDDPVLRKIAKEVPIDEIGSKKIQKIIQDMQTALDSCDDGVAIAAPQIGIPLRIFMVSPKAFLKETEVLTNIEVKKLKHPVFINPKILKLSSKTAKMDEGCLSVRGIFGKVRRSEKATIEAYDETGKKFTRGASGLLAEIFQHEIEHLEGILFIDSAKELYQILNDDEGGNK